MYKIEKRFTIPIGHRLSKHAGRCFSLHGHNFTILVGLKAKRLNENDMVIDFSEVKTKVNALLDNWDHCLLINQDDKYMVDKLENLGIRIEFVPFDPTAERLAETIFKALENAFTKNENHTIVDYVTVYENDDSKATYTLD